MTRKRWTLREIEEALTVAHQALGDQLTLTHYETWRREQATAYPSSATIRRQYGDEDVVKYFLRLGKTKWSLKWTEERIWECLKRAYQELSQEGLSLTPKNYQSWRSVQLEETPSYTSIREKLGGFKSLKIQFFI